MIKIFDTEFKQFLKMLHLKNGEIFRLGAEERYYYRFNNRLLEFTSIDDRQWGEAYIGIYKKILTGEVVITKLPTVETNIETVYEKYGIQEKRKEAIEEAEKYLKENFSTNGIKEIISIIESDSKYKKEKVEYKLVKKWQKQYFDITEETKDMNPTTDLLRMIVYKRNLEEWVKRK